MTLSSWIEILSVVAGIVIAALAYAANSRRSVWLRSLLSVIRGIEGIRAFRRKDGRIEIDEEELVRILSRVQEADGTRSEVRKAIRRSEEQEGE